MNPQPLPFAHLAAISDRTLSIHHGKLYAGYVTKANEIADKLAQSTDGQLAAANQSFSELRALKDGETFAVNGAYLHEWYFETLGGDGQPAGTLVDRIVQDFGSFDRFQNLFSACGLAARGWVVLAYDLHESALRICSGDAHNQGGVWGCVPLLVLDVYEHAYFLDFGSDRQAYIAAWWKNLDWKKIDARYQKTA